MTKAYAERFPLVSDVRNMLTEALEMDPNMTLKGFLEYFDGITFQYELEMLKTAEAEQLTEVLRRDER